MLPGTNRLKKKKDFEYVFKQGRGLKEGFLSLKFARNSLGLTRFGFVVGQKVSRKAVVRNKVKRRLREIAKSSLGDIKKGFDVVIIVSKGAERGTKEDTAAIFNYLFKTGRLLND
ncbi:MAG: ribonuclease P protein component [Candidatus Nealsonbacteria bacterium]